MPAVHIVADDTAADVADRLLDGTMPTIYTTSDWTFVAIRGGMQSGATSIRLAASAFVNGQLVRLVADTSLNAIHMAASALSAIFEDETGQPGYARLSDDARALLIPRYAEAVRRSIPSTTPEQALEAAEMIIDSLAADAPPNT